MKTSLDDEYRTAQAEMEAAQARIDAIKQAQRARRDRERAARHQAWQEWRQTTSSLGYQTASNRAFDAFAAAVRNGDGAAVLTAWLVWRREYAASRVVGTAIEHAGRHKDFSVSDGHGNHYEHPDFSGDVRLVMTQIEHEVRRAKADEITADHAQRAAAIVEAPIPEQPAEDAETDASDFDEEAEGVPAE